MAWAMVHRFRNRFPAGLEEPVPRFPPPPLRGELGTVPGEPEPTHRFLAPARPAATPKARATFPWERADGSVWRVA